MVYPIELKSSSQLFGDLARTVLANTDLSDVAPGSSLSVLLEAIASNDFQLAVTAFKILENSALESLVGTALDKKAEAIRLPNGIGGFGRQPSTQASGPITIGSSFQKVSSKLYAGKPAPFPGSQRLYLEDASKFTPTGNIYIGRGTVDRFEGPIAYTSVVNSGSFWTIELATPLTKGHLTNDLVVLAQGGDRSIQAGTIVQVPSTSNGPSINFTVNSTVVIPDGESEATATVTCVQFGEIGNALSGSIKAFSASPFGGATVTNPTSYTNGRSSESDEDLRKRIKNYPSTLSRGTKTAILAAIQGINDPDTGRTLTSSVGVEPTEPGDSSKVYIDDGTGLEPTFDVQPYELLLQSASGQETAFRTSKFPIIAATIIGSEFGPFAIAQGMSLTVVADGVAETYTITTSNYANLNSVTPYEIIRDFNSQSNIVGFRTIDGGRRIAMTDLSGNIEELSVQSGDLQQLLGLPLAVVRPIFVYKNNEIQSYRGATGTLTTNAYPWGLTASDLDGVRIKVDGVIQTITITDSDFVEFNTNIASATLSQWQTVFTRKVAGVKFFVSGSVLVWSTWQQFSPTGSIEILTTRSDGSAAGWIADSKMWKPVSSGGVLYDVGSTKDFNFNRFTGEINFTSKPQQGSTIEIGSRTTRAQLVSNTAPSGLFTMNSLPLSTGNSKMVVGFDGEFAIRPVIVNIGATVTPSIPDTAGATNVVRLFANDSALFGNAQVGDYLYLVKDQTTVPGWGSVIEGIYQLKAVGINGFAVNQTYTSVVASTLSGSAEVTINQANHNFKTGARITVTTATAIGGISAGNLSQALATITVLNSAQYKYTSGAVASSTATGALDQVVYDADTWVEFEVSAPQLVDWTALLATPQSITTGMVNIFRSTAIPQIVDFGAVGAVSVDVAVSTINSQIASGTAVKINPQSLRLRSNDFESGTAAILASIGNAANMFATGVASSIQSHIAYSDTGYAKSGFPVIEAVLSPSAATTGKAWRYFMQVDASFTDVIDTATNPAIESPSFVTEYPVGFEQLWLTGRNQGLSGRVYNNQTTAPFTGIMRCEGAIRSLQTSDTLQTTPDSLDRYANYGLRFTDLTVTNHDRLVVEMDLDPIDKTVAVPLYKRALIQDIDAITGNGKGQVISLRLKDPEDLDPDNSNLPRPFFDTQSVYRTYDFRDFRLVARSVGLYRDFSTYGAYASGSLTAIASGSPSGIQDGDTFSLNDGVNPVVTFEFNGTGGVSPGNVAIAYTPGVAASGSLTAISAAPGTGIQDGDTFVLNDGIHPAVIFEFDSNGSTTVGTTPVTFIAGTAASGTLTATAADPVTGIAVGDTFVVSDGVTPKTFEFETGGGVTPGNVSVLLPSATATANQVKTAILAALVGSTLNITSTSGVGLTIDLVNNTLGTAGNVAITETFVNGVSLFPSGMSGGIDYDTAAAIRTAIIAAINGAVSLDITAAPGSGSLINLVCDATGTQGNQTITETLANGTLTPVGMAGGVDEATAATIKAAIISAINGATLGITALAGPGDLIYLSNDTAGIIGNIAITESMAMGTLTPVGMAGGTNATTTNRALVLRSIEQGSPSRLRLSIRYADQPSQTDIVISHANSYRENEARLTVYATLPTTAAVLGSLYNTGTYTVFVAPQGTLFKITFVGAGLNPGGQYQVGNVLNVNINHPLGGTYLINSASPGSVSVLAPGNGGVTTGTIFSAIQFPLQSWGIAPKTWEDLANAINAYLPDTPIATAEALGTNFVANPIVLATYVAYPAATAYTGVDMSGAFSHHSFKTYLSGVSGVFVYDSSNPGLNNIKATVQSDDPMFPTTADAAGTTYTPIDEEVTLIPANSKSLRSWLNFNAASSLPIIADASEIRSSSVVQISSKQDGSLGAVRITGVTANTIESFVVGNGTVDDDAARISVLATDAQSLVRGNLVRIDNSVTTELFRPYRNVPVGASETTYNTMNVNTFFRPTNSIKYVRLTANTARLVFMRFGTGIGQTEPLTSGDQITLTNLGNGFVQVTSAGGDLAARVGDEMIIKNGSAFPADAQCKALPGSSGVTAGNTPDYRGYPVVHVIDTQNVIVVAPNITTFGSTNITSATDLIFLPAIYSEKNIRTNHQEGSKFDSLVNSGNMYILVKPIGGNMMSVWVQNSANASTDTMRLSDMLVNTDDWVTLGTGFDLANQGTYKLVAHNGSNHLIVYNPNGGKDEIIDTATITGGGIGQRDWKIGPLADANIRPVRIVDGESVRLGDRLRISTPVTANQWFPDTMIGSFEIIGLGYIGVNQATGTLTAVAADPGTGITDGDTFTLSDGFVTRTFEFDTNASWNIANVRVQIGATDGAGAVRAAIIAAINSLGSALQITASAGSGTIVNLLNRRLVATTPNVAITELFANLGVTLTPVGMSGATVSDGSVQHYIDIAMPNGTPVEIYDNSGVPVNFFTIAGNDGAIGFVESANYFGFRTVAGHGISPTNTENAELFLLPRLSVGKMAQTFGTKVTAMYKTGFEERTFQGIDGYKVFAGLVREAHRVIDGLPSNPILFPGVKAMGTVVEVLPPMNRSVQIDLQVRPKDGVTLNSINEVVRSSVASYVNRLGVGQPVILSEIVRIVQGLPGVFSVTVLNTRPAVFDDRIVVSAVEKAYIINASTDITIG